MSGLHVDVTFTLVTGMRTGIQRVVRQIVGHLEGRSEIVPVIALHGRFHRLTNAGLAELLHPTHDVLGQGTGRVSAMLKATLDRVPRLYRHVQQASFERRARALAALYDPDPVSFGGKDVVVLLDSFWGGSTTLQAARRAHRQGARIVGYVHDLIPLTHPRFMPNWQRIGCGAAVRDLASFASGMMTTSRYTSSTLRAFLGETRSPPIEHNYHGHDIAPVEPARDRVRDDETYAMIGTIEPRKGHAVVLAAFERLWAEGHAAKLVFVGRMGWVERDFAEALTRHPELGRRLAILNDASDADLAAILARSTAAIVASAVEGFGLPVVEALAAGVPVIASDIPVFREIAGDHAAFFPAEDAGALAAVLRDFLRDAPDRRNHARTFSWPSWRQSADRFARLARDLADSNG